MPARHTSVVPDIPPSYPDGSAITKKGCVQRSMKLLNVGEDVRATYGAETHVEEPNAHQII